MATYPSGLKTYTNKVDGVDIVLAADINSVQSEIQAVEAELGISPKTSAIPASVGTYSPSGTNSTVAARLTNLEAGLTANATDGSRVGYTQLATGAVSTSNSITVAGLSYIKLVVVVNYTTIGSGTQLLMKANSATSSKYGYMSFATTPAGAGSAASSEGIPISSAVAPSNGDTIVAEIYNCAGAGTKPVTFTNAIGWGAGAYISGGSIAAAITNITLTSATAPTAATYTIYGVK